MFSTFYGYFLSGISRWTKFPKKWSPSNVHSLRPRHFPPSLTVKGIRVLREEEGERLREKAREQREASSFCQTTELFLAMISLQFLWITTWNYLIEMHHTWGNRLVHNSIGQHLPKYWNTWFPSEVMEYEVSLSLDRSEWEDGQEQCKSSCSFLLLLLVFSWCTLLCLLLLWVLLLLNKIPSFKV